MIASKNNDVLIFANYKRFGLMYGWWTEMEGNTRVATRYEPRVASSAASIAFIAVDGCEITTYTYRSTN